MFQQNQEEYRMMQTGFPDFIAYKLDEESPFLVYEVNFVECKSNGYLKPEEKEKG